MRRCVLGLGISGDETRRGTLQLTFDCRMRYKDNKLVIELDHRTTTIFHSQLYSFLII
jgi:hypothetical protein